MCIIPLYNVYIQNINTKYCLLWYNIYGAYYTT